MSIRNSPGIDTRGVTSRWESLRSASALEAHWRELEPHARSPFHVWQWVHTWLSTLPPGLEVMLFKADDAAGPVALGLFGVRPERGLRRLGGRVSLWLQETGVPAFDELTVEYTGLLVRPGCEATAYRALGSSLQQLRPRPRQLWLSACDHAGTISAALPTTVRAYAQRRRTSYFIDLDMLRAQGRAYPAALSASTRAELRRTARAYAALGELRIEVASEPAQALAMLDELEELHTTYWRARGHAGAFGNAHFRTFHRRLIGSSPADGLPRLLRFHAGSIPLGVGYYLRWRGRDYCYNSGLRYGLLPRNERPGAVAHLLGVEASLADGMSAYDFMAGDADYKRMFSTHAYDVHCVQLRMEGLWSGAERMTLRALGRDQPEALPRAAPSDGLAVRALR